VCRKSRTVLGYLLPLQRQVGKAPRVAPPSSYRGALPATPSSAASSMGLPLEFSIDSNVQNLLKFATDFSFTAWGADRNARISCPVRCGSSHLFANRETKAEAEYGRCRAQQKVLGMWRRRRSGFGELWGRLGAPWLGGLDMMRRLLRIGRIECSRAAQAGKKGSGHAATCAMTYERSRGALG
jgi:hypothetical protein